jgi:hypothetical protein
VRGLIDLAFVLEEQVVAVLRANTTLTTLLGGNAGAIRQMFTGQKLLFLPSGEVSAQVGIFRVADDVAELEIPVILQFNWFGPTLNIIRQVRKETLRTVMSDYTETLGTLQVWTRYLGTRREQDPQEGIAHLSGDVEFHPYREYSQT